MAWIQQFADRDWAGADASYNRARALDPGNAVVLSHAAILARILGHLDEAIALDRQALERDPLRPGGYHNAGVICITPGTMRGCGIFQESVATVSGG